MSEPSLKGKKPHRKGKNKGGQATKAEGSKEEDKQAGRDTKLNKANKFGDDASVKSNKKGVEEVKHMPRETPRTYSIFGAGASGLWTALRLSEGQNGPGGSNEELPMPGDIINIYDPTKYAFSEALTERYREGDRIPGGRISTYFYGQKGHNGDWADYKKNTNAEMGGMRYVEYDEKESVGGQRLVTHLINHYDLKGDKFNTTPKPLKYIDGKHQWVGYDTEEGTYWNAAYQNILKRHIEKYLDDNPGEAVDGCLTRNRRAKFYNKATFDFSGSDPRKQVYDDETKLKNIGFWNLIVADPHIGSEGYDYLLKTAGYNSIMMNLNAASAIITNSEFIPGSTTFHSIKGGYSTLFDKMFRTIEENCDNNGIIFNYHSKKKLVSIYAEKKEGDTLTKAGFILEEPGQLRACPDAEYITDHAFLCMPRCSLEKIVATSMDEKSGSEKYYILKDEEVQLRLESVEPQPSFKIGAFFDKPWYDEVRGNNNPNLKLDIIPHEQPGPTITDLPLRQTYYFGDNSLPGGEKKYAMLLGYEDMANTDFWHHIRFSEDRKLSDHGNDLGSYGCQYIDVENNSAFRKLLRNLIAEIHDLDITDVPDPCEAMIMDWSVDPFGGGYHRWKPHYDIPDVQEKIRRPCQFIKDTTYIDNFKEAPIYIAGEAYSEDQGWVEGAFCTAESVLADYFGVEPMEGLNYEDYDLVMKNGD